MSDFHAGGHVGVLEKNKIKMLTSQCSRIGVNTLEAGSGHCRCTAQQRGCAQWGGRLAAGNLQVLVAVAASHWAARAGATTPHSITVVRIAGKGRCVVGLKRWCVRAV